MGQLARVRSPAPWLQPDGQTFYIDLLFYHVRLHCYFAFELKVGAFQPEHAGKLGFYLAAVPHTMRTPVEGPSIGVLLCESRSGPIVEFSLENTNQPIGVSTYQVTRELPAPMQEELPSVEDLQEVVNKLRSEMETLPREPRRGIKCSVSRETGGSPNPVNVQWAIATLEPSSASEKFMQKERTRGQCPSRCWHLVAGFLGEQVVCSRSWCDLRL